MARPNVLVIDDEEDILELVRHNLTKDGCEVECASSGEAGLAAARARGPNLILLDLMLPGLDGLEVCRLLKRDPRTERIPVVMLSAKGEESDIVAGLELGADDYVTKPFSPKILTARVRAALRRRGAPAPDLGETISLHDLTINPGRHEVLIDGEPTERLTVTEFRILHLLARRPGWVLTRHQIVEGVRGDMCAVTDRSVDVQIVGLRKKLGAAGALIETVRGVGYRFKE